MLISSASCSMILLISRVTNSTRLAAPLTSTLGPSPLAFTTVFSVTRNVSIIARGFYQMRNSERPSNQTDPLLRRMRTTEVEAAGLLRGFEVHQLHPREIR